MGALTRLRNGQSREKAMAIDRAASTFRAGVKLPPVAAA
jgi:hypothetical protein